MPTARSRRPVIRLLAFLILPWVTPAAAPAQPAPSRPPNIVFILSDDQGYQDLGCYGSPNIRTPHIDRMAAEGMRFTDFYAASPLCTPSRAALLTGCYPVRVSMGDFPIAPGQTEARSSNVLYPNSPIGLNPDEVTIPDVLTSAGYTTALVGKWHLGDAPALLPLRQGFDTYFGIPYANDQKPLYYLDGDTRLDEPVDMNTITRRLTGKAVEVIRTNKDRPFFLFLSHPMPHVPLGAGPDFRGKSKAGPYGDAVEELDWSVGQILATLKELNLDKQTLVVFTSDNGPWLQRGAEGGNANPLRAGKGTTYEGGVRVPCVIRWPGHVPAGSVSHAMTSMIDFLPTFARLAGATSAIPADRPIDGKDLSPILRDPAAPTPHEYLLFYSTRNRLAAIRSGNWKLKFETTLQEETHYGKTPNPDTPIPPRLTDLTLDPAEQKSLLKDHPDVVERLTDLANRARQDLGDARTNTVGKGVRPVGRVP